MITSRCWPIDFAQDYYSKEYKGDFGFHSEGLFQAEYIPQVPLDFAFNPDVAIGTVSLPLSDNATYKQLGYWLIKVNDRPSETTANVTAIYCGEESQATDVRAQIMAGANVTDLADQYSQYTSIGQHGELGVVSTSDNISLDFNNYVFDPDAEARRMEHSHPGQY